MTEIVKESSPELSDKTTNSLGALSLRREIASESNVPPENFETWGVSWPD
jgi:hypothetical protein